MTDILEQARGTLKWFTRTSLLGQLVDELAQTRDDLDHWRRRAIAAEEEACDLREQVGMMGRDLALATRDVLRPKRTIRDLLPKWR